MSNKVKRVPVTPRGPNETMVYLSPGLCGIIDSMSFKLDGIRIHESKDNEV